MNYDTPNCPECGSDMVVERIYLNREDISYDISVKNGEVELNGWQRNDLPQYSCMECKQEFS